MINNQLQFPKGVEWKDDALILLDQTKLPLETKYIKCETAEAVWDCIKSLQVRGAPAIGIAGAYGYYLGMRSALMAGKQAPIQELYDYLLSCRPTAVNLQWCLQRVLKTAQKSSEEKHPTLLNNILNESHRIFEEDRSVCYRLAKFGRPLIKSGMNVLTHCHTGMMAVSEWGTALGVMHLASRDGEVFHVYVDETRPLLQGSRLTAWELMQAKISCTLITDNMSAFLMAQKKVDLILVGADRVTKNGDVANKIGTLGLAVLAKHFGVPFYVATPLSTVDWEMNSGSQIHIEERAAREITHIRDQQVAPEGVNVYNPAFDITPHELITGIITERGIFAGPHYMEKLASVIKTY
jgi:methylthioribose-1-phosphate isomerase